MELNLWPGGAEVEPAAAFSSDSSWAQHRGFCAFSEAGSPDFLLILWASWNPSHKALYCQKLYFSEGTLPNKYGYPLLAFREINGLCFKHISENCMDPFLSMPLHLWQGWFQLPLSEDMWRGGFHIFGIVRRASHWGWKSLVNFTSKQKCLSLSSPNLSFHPSLLMCVQ